MKILQVVLLTLLTSAGCATQTTPVDPKSIDLSHKLNDFKNSTQRGFSPYDLYDPSGKNPGLTNHAGFNSYQRWWCANPSNVHVLAKNYISQYCENLGGSFQNNWCKKSDLESPLFYAKVGFGNMVDRSIGKKDCASGTQIGIFAITNEKSIKNKQWNTWIKNNLDYKTDAEKETIVLNNKKQKAIKNTQENIRKEQQAQQILAGGIGTKVCKKQRNLTFVGFVENIANNKMKVTIVSAYVGNNPNIQPGGFKQTITWDKPENWYTCY